jgi:hypothetical protein
MFSRPNASVAIENLEERKLMAAAPTIIAIKIAKRQDTDTTALNSNRITIGFSSAVRLGDVSKFSSFGYANNLADATGATQVKARVGLTITQPASNVIEIITDRLIRKGSRMTVLTGGLADTKGNAIVYGDTNAITFTTGQNKPRYTLSNRQFVATDLAYLDKDVFASAPTATTASTTPVAATVRAALVAFLNKKLTTTIGTKITQAQYNFALTTYDATATAAIFPNANMRAALVSLVGTVAEPAINSYLTKGNASTKPYTLVNFGTVSNGTPVGETSLSPGGRLSLIVNSVFAGEPFQVVSATLAHEALHQDAANNVNGDLPSGQDEEIVANAVETVVWAQQLLVDAAPAANASKLVVRTNTRLLALLNSGDKLFPYGGIFAAPSLNNQGNVFVGGKANPGGFTGSTNVPSFENWIRREYITRGFASGASPTSAVGQAILKNIVGTTGTFTSFGADVEGYLDTRNAILTDITYIRLAQILKLKILV